LERLIIAESSKGDIGYISEKGMVSCFIKITLENPFLCTGIKHLSAGGRKINFKKMLKIRLFQ